MSEEQELHVVLGASGGVGCATVNGLAQQGKQVRVINRSGRMDLPEGVEVVAADAMDPTAIIEASKGATVIYHCIHPRGDYSQFVPMTENIVAAAEGTGAKLVMAASCYPYGKVDRPMTEDMPYHPEAASGEYHAKAAEIAMDAHKSGRIQATIGRASNYFGPNAPRMLPGIDFREALDGKGARVIGDVDQPHTYTFSEDFANGLVTLGASDEALGEIWHIPSAETTTTKMFCEMLYDEAESELKITAGTKTILTIMSWFNSSIKPALEVYYQFDRPFIVDHSKYENAFGANPTTNLNAIQKTIAWFRADAA